MTTLPSMAGTDKSRAKYELIKKMMNAYVKRASTTKLLAYRTLWEKLEHDYGVNIPLLKRQYHQRTNSQYELGMVSTREMIYSSALYFALMFGHIDQVYECARDLLLSTK